MGPSPRRLRENEETMERINERIDERTEEIRDEDDLEADAPVGFFCECSDLGCTARVPLAPSVFRRIHEDPEQFVLVPGHELLDIERVIDRADGYVVVRKTV